MHLITKVVKYTQYVFIHGYKVNREHIIKTWHINSAIPPPGHLIPPLVYRKIRVGLTPDPTSGISRVAGFSHSLIVFPAGLMLVFFV
jgi:hypothetical protein